jgi:hypothetical protein
MGKINLRIYNLCRGHGPAVLTAAAVGHASGAAELMLTGPGQKTTTNNDDD